MRVVDDDRNFDVLFRELGYGPLWICVLVDVCVQLLVPTSYHVDDLVVSRREDVSAGIVPRLGLLALRVERWLGVTYDAEKVPSMAFAAQETETRLLGVSGCETPYSDRGVFRGRGDDPRIGRRCGKVIDTLVMLVVATGRQDIRLTAPCPTRV